MFLALPMTPLVTRNNILSQTPNATRNEAEFYRSKFHMDTFGCFIKIKVI